jgi:hypothetical protein
MNPREFGIFANRLANQDNAAVVELRTAVGRAYYSSFNVGIGLLKKLGVKLPGGWEGHRLLSVALRHCQDNALTIVSHELDDLRTGRWAADYDMLDHAVEDQRTVRKWCARAKQIIKKMDECEADSERFLEVRIKVRNWAGSAEGASKGFGLL